MRLAVPGLQPGQGSYFIAPPTAEYRNQSWLSCKPDKRIQATVKPILQPHLDREPSQQSYPAVLRQWHTPPTTNLRAQTVASPKIRPYKQAPPAQRPYQQISPETQTEVIREELYLPKGSCKVWTRRPLTQIHRY